MTISSTLSAPASRSSVGSPAGSSALSSVDLEIQLGEQIRSLRLDAGLDQKGLAEAADVGLSSVKNLENGRGSSLHTVVKVVRALGASDWLTQLAPVSTVSPLEVLRRAPAAERKRVYRPRSRG